MSDGHAVVLTGAMYDPAGEALLSAVSEPLILDRPSERRLVEAVAGAEVLFNRYPVRVSARVLDAAPRLRLVCTSGRGTDAVDVEAATRLGIGVANNPGFGAVPVSEHTIAMLLALAKRTIRMDGAVRVGSPWEASQEASRIELDGRTLGIVGLGSIGSVVARKCRAAFDMRVLAYDPYVDARQAEAVGAELVDRLEDLLAASDFVSVHAALNAETRGMIGAAELAAMREDAFLVNTARGPIVQQEALVQALEHGVIAGASLDVYESEPVGSDNPLCGLENVILTPHVAGLTDETVRAISVATAERMLAALAGERPDNLVNPQAWGRRVQPSQPR